MRGVLSLISAGLACLACSDQTGPITALRGGDPGSAAYGKVSVLTLNMYPGTNLDLVVAALGSPDPNDDAPALITAIQTLQATDFGVRAGLMADEIARNRPDAVGLQEVSYIYIDAAYAGQTIEIDFLPVLQTALAARGLNYTVAAAGTDYTLMPLPGIIYSQGDALLLNSDRVTLNSASHSVYSNNLGVVAPGIELKQGWAVADATVGGRQVVFVTTHPEADFAGNDLSLLRTAQLTELLGTLDASVPVILMGDLNTDPGEAPYQLLTEAGMVDVWRALRPGVRGLTCCHADDLSDQVPSFDQRIDYVFARGFDHGPAGLQGRIWIFGDQPSERAAGPVHPLWASDHAGLEAVLLPPRE